MSLCIITFKILYRENTLIPVVVSSREREEIDRWVLKVEELQKIILEEKDESKYIRILISQ